MFWSCANALAGLREEVHRTWAWYVPGPERM